MFDKMNAQLSAIVRTWTELLQHYIIYNISPYSKDLSSRNCKEGNQRIRSAEQLYITVIGTIRNVHVERCCILRNEIYEDIGEC